MTQSSNQPSIVYHPTAELELAKTAEWYKTRSAPAAQRFRVEYYSSLNRIIESPESWPVFELGTRRVLLDRFPFNIIYRVESSHIQIIAIMHQSRRPGYWHSR